MEKVIQFKEVEYKVKQEIQKSENERRYIVCDNQGSNFSILYVKGEMKTEYRKAYKNQEEGIQIIYDIEEKKEGIQVLMEDIYTASTKLSKIAENRELTNEMKQAIKKIKNEILPFMNIESSDESFYIHGKQVKHELYITKASTEKKEQASKESKSLKKPKNIRKAENADMKSWIIVGALVTLNIVSMVMINLTIFDMLGQNKNMVSENIELQIPEEGNTKIEESNINEYINEYLNEDEEKDSVNIEEDNTKIEETIEKDSTKIEDSKNEENSIYKPIYTLFSYQEKMEVIQFKDACMEELIRYMLNKKEEDIYAYEMENIREINVVGNYVINGYDTIYRINNDPKNKEIYLSGEKIEIGERGKISSLEDLKHCKALQRLTLINQQIIDITPLANLDRLYHIDLSDNSIEDVTPLANKEIMSLSLNHNKIKNLFTIKSSIKECIILHVACNEITEISSLGDMERLARIDLRYNKIKEEPKIEFPNAMVEYMEIYEGNPFIKK